MCLKRVRERRREDKDRYSSHLLEWQSFHVEGEEEARGKRACCSIETGNLTWIID